MTTPYSPTDRTNLTTLTTADTVFKYEMFFDSKPDDPIQIHGWHPIPTERITYPEKIPEYLERGILREISQPLEIINNEMTEADYNHETFEQFGEDR